MSFIKESYNSRSITLNETATSELQFVASGYDDEVLAIAAALASIPSSFGGAALDELSVQDRIATKSWLLRARYSLKRATAINASAGAGTGGSGIDLEAEEIDYQSSGEEKHITHSLSTLGYPFSAPTERAIGATKDGIAGTNVPAGISTFKIVRQFLRSGVTDELRAAWDLCRGKVNDDTWRGWDAGEVLFESWSVNLQGKSNNKVNVAFNFKARKNVVDVVYPSPVGTVPLIEGHWVVDERYDEIESGSKIIKKLTAVYLHQVIPYHDFNTLGLS